MNESDKAWAALGAWKHAVEKLAEHLHDCYEREKSAREKGEPTQSSDSAYAHALHEVTSVFTQVGRSHNEAVRALRALKESPK
jgi:hypothetical protein